MKRAFSLLALAAATVLTIATIASCGDDSSTNVVTGSVSGTVTFQGTWPSTGHVQVSIFSNLSPPDYAPGGPPDGFTTPIAPNSTTYAYRIAGLDPGHYSAIYVGWRDAANPSGAVMIGVYWMYADSLGVVQSGPKVVPKTPGPAPIHLAEPSLNPDSLDIVADLDLTP